MLWAIFLLILLLISFSATSYSKVVDATLIVIRLAIVVVLSILTVREWWRNRNDEANPDRGDHFLRRCRRWFYDQPEPKRGPRA